MQIYSNYFFLPVRALVNCTFPAYDPFHLRYQICIPGLGYLVFGKLGYLSSLYYLDILILY